MKRRLVLLFIVSLIMAAVVGLALQPRPTLLVLEWAHKAPKETPPVAVLIEFGIDKPSQKLQVLIPLSADELAAEVKKIRGKKKPLTVADVKRLGDEHTASVVPLQTLAHEADRLERLVSDRVNEAFGLTPADVQLMWETAPPRMPLASPQS